MDAQDALVLVADSMPLILAELRKINENLVALGLQRSAAPPPRDTRTSMALQQLRQPGPAKEVRGSAPAWGLEIGEEELVLGRS